MLCSDVLDMAIKTYGEQMQMDILIEEMAELTKELIKTKRRAWRDDGKYHLDRRVFEEFVDVRIVLDQMELLLRAHMGGDDEYFKQYEEQRLKVLNELLNRINRDRRN